MEGINRATLLGNVGADPELKFTQSGTALLKIRMVTETSYLDRNKARQTKSEWHSVIVWSKRAEALAKIICKGSRILVEGAIETTSYEGRDGTKRYQTQIRADSIHLCGGKSGSGGASRAPAGKSDWDEPPSDAPPAEPPAGGGGWGDSPSTGGSTDDDIPF